MVGVDCDRADTPLSSERVQSAGGPCPITGVHTRVFEIVVDSSHEETRAALFNRDDGLLAWYDNRLNMTEPLASQ